MAQASHDQLAPPVRAVFDALERATVRWCLLRGDTDLHPAVHDLDLLVAPEDVPMLAAAVRPLGFVAVPTRARGTHQFFVSYVRSLDRWLILDVVTELSFGPGYSLRTPAAAGCLARREAVGSLVVPSADDAFWALLLHRLLDRGNFRAQDRERLQRLVREARTDGELARVAATICPGDGDPAVIAAAVRRSDWGELSALGARLLANWRLKHPARSRVHRVIASVGWRLGPHLSGLALPGLRFALVADDSATARHLAAALARGFYLPITPLRVVERPPLPVGAGPLARRLLASVVRSIVARLHQLRGRLVALPVADSVSESAATAVRAVAPGFGAQFVFDIRADGGNGSGPGRKKRHENRYLSVRGMRLHDIESDGSPDRVAEPLSAVTRALTAGLWWAYCERRG